MGNSSRKLSNSSFNLTQFTTTTTHHDDLDQEPILPSDELQIERWKAHHYLLKEYWGRKNFYAPIHEWLKTGGFKVLDVGCGPGLEYPLSQFIGVDVLSLLPKNSPPNIKFVQANIRSTLPFADNTFDYIHMRHMMFYFTEQEWITVVMPELIRILKPGGYIELVEGDMEWYNVSPTTRILICAVHNSMRRRGINPFLVNRLAEIMESTEMLENIYHKVQETQIGKWANHKGETLLNIFLQLFTGFKLAQCKILNISPNQFDDLLQKFKDDVEIYKTYCKSNRFYANKKYV